jgi:predicted amidohydrolase
MRLALAQWDVSYGDVEANLSRLLHALPQFSERGVDLTVFPEAYLTGYCAASEEDVRQIAIPTAERGGPLWEAVRNAVMSNKMGVVVGYAGIDPNDALVNAATLVLPDGSAHTYCKTHLPFLGMDRFVQPGRELPVFDTPWGKVGILICYDQRMPEPPRVLALKGADLIILPTNWPGTNQTADYYTVVRASENKVFYAACNRVGTEHGFTFIGLSGIYGPDGRIIAKAGAVEDVLVADIDLSEARDKVNVYRPGEYELHLWSCRQPELYARISEPS